jgi:hypothetical protein
MPVEPLDHQVIETWSGQAATALSASSISVSLVNISGSPTRSATVSAGLAALGFQIAGTTAAPSPAAVTETVVHYHPGSLAQGLAVLHSLSGAVMLQSDPAVADATVALYLGSAVAVAAKGPVAPGAPAPGTSTGSATMPTGAGSGSTTNPVPTAGGSAPSSAVDQAAQFDPVAC